MTITPGDIANTLMDTERELRIHDDPANCIQIMVDRSGISRDDEHAIIQIIIGRAEYWDTKRRRRPHEHPKLVLAAAFADGLFIGLETAKADHEKT